MKSLEAQRKAPLPERTIVVANRPLRFGDQLTASTLRELPWPQDALPAGAFGKIADLTAAKRVVLMPIEAQRGHPRLEDHRSGRARHAFGGARSRHDGGDRCASTTYRASPASCCPAITSTCVDAAGREEHRRDRRRDRGRKGSGDRPARRREDRQAVGRQGGHARGQRHRRREDRAGFHGRHAVAAAAQGRRNHGGRFAPGDARGSRQARQRRNRNRASSPLPCRARRRTSASNSPVPVEHGNAQSAALSRPAPAPASD